MDKEMLITANEIEEKGFYDVDIDPTLDLFSEIERLKKEKNAIILAHLYQEPDIQDIADYIGDSLWLAQQAAKTDADMIVFAGSAVSRAALLLAVGRKSMGGTGVPRSPHERFKRGRAPTLARCVEISL